MDKTIKWNVGDLRRLIADLPDDMILVCMRFSDLQDMELPQVCEVIPIKGGYKWYYPGQWDKDPLKILGRPQEPKRIKALYFEVN